MDNITNIKDECEVMRERLEDLPQELYDQIYKTVFTAPPGVRNMHNGDGVNTRLLQISRASRALYAKSYYGAGADFVFTSEMYLYHSTMLSWIQVLPAEHLEYIERITMISFEQASPAMIALEIDWVKASYQVLGLDHVVSKCVFVRKCASMISPMGRNDGLEDNKDEHEPGRKFGQNRIDKLDDWIVANEGYRCTRHD
ncbi:uncharacterized protein RCC_01314 [Ramularia collo-cygni]|uniref:Uncharacterized protein n=1 Tax=Ramularia collo-cygni TaxID=112498 RepID=A0A2D3UP24_9PEZI|nr:uncharacterized protein RCC_01314 [Ramularia collo-cygni]CZT15458.1 uncharacterized protein RCC_01314 [Ramularia collo-cygni]